MCNRRTLRPYVPLMNSCLTWIHKNIKAHGISNEVRYYLDVNITTSCAFSIIKWFTTVTVDYSEIVTGPVCRKISNIRRTKFQHSNVSHLFLQLSLPNPLEPGVKLIMKM